MKKNFNIKQNQIQSSKSDRERYFDNVILNVVQGIDFGFWSKLIDLIMNATEKEYIKYQKDYPELLEAINRYNNAHKTVGYSNKLQRKCK